ncbi:hypothetical protein GDO86_008904 [Hymenochirus boettgeri]|uniref:Peroxisomal membrane protein PEX16 n=1 Tax=Hymenochirus boettgeri TaxID=247094 RepID=A0A8T2J4U6_9PIPI|nr:hypothetical protein GDO86_008904 [Hymenochirus boettgeri]
MSRACLRIVLLLWYKVGIQSSPPVTPLNREGILNQTEEKGSNRDSCFVGKRTSRAVRTLNESSSCRRRFWRSPQVNECNHRTNGDSESDGESSSLGALGTVAEAIHILRPITHLVCLAKWGQKSWKPWMLAATLDVTRYVSV